MPGQRPPIRIPLVLLLLGLLCQVGCVALNIPSERHHDVNDHGGLFGHWRDQSPVDQFHEDDSSVAIGQGVGVQPIDCIDGGPLEVDPFDDSVDCHGEQKSAKPIDVPWPRFHPVPTRPVFGATEQPWAVAP